jgi:release factor glutamine methyltransferase
MKIPSNKVGDVHTFFLLELKTLYASEEIALFSFFCFEKFLGFQRPTDLLLRAEETMSESDLLKFNAAAKELSRRRPIQYILGTAPFCGLHFRVNENVLIPRPETEELVERIRLEQGNRELRLLDIGTGSGCIAIALKRLLRGAEVHALEISAPALDLARENAAKNNAEVCFYQFDILEDPQKWKGGQFDLIVSNPPYILSAEMQDMDETVKAYEPHLALFVEDDGLLFYKRIIAFAALYLKPGGRIHFEINAIFGEGVSELLARAGYLNVEIHTDLNSNERFVSASRP